MKSQGYFIKTKRLNGFEKDDLLDVIRNYWILNPDLRLCQLLSNITAQADIDIYYYEDRRLLKVLKKYLGEK